MPWHCRPGVRRTALGPAAGGEELPTDEGEMSTLTVWQAETHELAGRTGRGRCRRGVGGRPVRSGSEVPVLLAVCCCPSDGRWPAWWTGSSKNPVAAHPAGDATRRHCGDRPSHDQSHGCQSRRRPRVDRMSRPLPAVSRRWMTIALLAMLVVALAFSIRCTSGPVGTVWSTQLGSRRLQEGPASLATFGRRELTRRELQERLVPGVGVVVPRQEHLLGGHRARAAAGSPCKS